MRRSDQPVNSQGFKSASGTRLRWLAALLGLATLPLILGFLCIPVLPTPPSDGGGTPASTFNPTVSLSLAATTAGSQSDITLSLDIPVGDVLPAGVFVKVPAGWGVANDADVIDGSLIGDISGYFRTDRIDDPVCRTDVTLEIDLIDATTDTGATVSGGDEDNDGQPDVVDDDVLADGSPGSNGLPDGVDLYPDFLTTLAPGMHKARYFGFDEAGGLTDLFVNLLVDDAEGASHLVTIIIGDPTRAALFGANKMCSPWSFTLTLNGTSADNPNTTPVEGGEAVYTNPSSSGEYGFTSTLVSERDADNDGVSNALDNCPLVANQGQGDVDGDGIGDACDPTMNEDTNSGDHDSDGIPNGHDNCPTVANADQADLDLDDLGDVSAECDPDTSVPNGAYHILYCEDPVGIDTPDPGPASCSSTPPTPTPTPTPTVTPTPSVTPTPTPIPDSDGDGIVDSLDNCPQDYNPDQSDGDDDGVGDACDNCPTVPNPGQENADAAISNGTGIPGDDATVPNGDPADAEGDACETDGDIDNDGILDASDSDPGGDITYDDNADGIMLNLADDGPSWDSNANGIIDGEEGNCPLAVNPNADDDGDGLLNTWEVCKWGTWASDPDGYGGIDPQDSDGDGINDCKEVCDVDGNGACKFTTDVIYNAKAALLTAAAFGKDGDYDIDGNNAIKFTTDTTYAAQFALLPGACKDLP